MGMSGGGGSRIKSIQTLVVTIPAATLSTNATIASVNTAKTVIQHAGQSGVDADPSRTSARLWLTSATQIGAMRAQSASANSMDVTAVIIEYE